MAGAKNWLKLLTGATAAGLLTVRVALGQGAGSAPPNAPPPTTAPVDDVDGLASTLANPNATAEQRNEAARRLVSRHTPHAHDVLQQALTDIRSPASQVAVARALAESSDPNPDPALIDPLFALLSTGARQAGWALAAYQGRPDVLTRLTDAATQRNNEPARLAAIEALGRIPEKPTAQTLIRLTTADAESDRVRAAAAAALVNLTGLEENDRDPQRWAQWWNDNAARPDVDFRADLLRSRARRYDAAIQRLGQLSDAAQRELREQYRAAPPAARPDMLMRLLTSDAPELRALGSTIVLDDKREGRRVEDAAIARLREMVGDSDPAVRLEVVRALQGDKQAFESLLAQLRVEANSDVRAALARALGPIGDPRAAEPLITLLGDSSPAVTAAAADAIRELGDTLHEKDAKASARAADSLHVLLARTDPHMQDLREAIVAAMASLREPILLNDFRQLANIHESVRVRREALRGIGNLGYRQSADLVNQFLSDRDPSVQVEAIAALGRMGAVEYYNSLVPLLHDEGLQREAWRSLQSFLPSMSADQLNELASQLQNDPEKRLEVLSRRADVLLKQRNLDDWADAKHSIGQVLDSLGRYDEAATNYAAALDQKLTQPNTPQMVIQRLITSLMNAQLKAKHYKEAVDFAAQQISKDANQQATMGPLIRQEAEQLLSATPNAQQPAPLDDVLKLIAEVRRMNPPLASQYMEMLNGIEQQARQRRTAG
jgi:HEAT repeat protein